MPDTPNHATPIDAKGRDASSIPQGGLLVNEPLAIVAMDCRLPQADSIGDYWQLLRDSRSAITPFPEEVLPRDLYFDPKKGVRGKCYTALGGLIKRRPVDQSILGLSDKEFADWDECHLIFAEVAARAWQSAKHSHCKDVGVYIGHSGGSRQAGELTCAAMAPQIAELLREIPEFESLDKDLQSAIIESWKERLQKDRPERRAGGRPYLEASSAARLVAEVCKLSGPRLVLDAACASSLVALALAAIDLQSGMIDAAIVGGASYNKVDSLILFSQAQSCSANGSRPFDQAADGLISSEGYIALVVKTLRRAIEDGDEIHSVIRGIGIATDGRGKSLWAPRREGQFNAMQRAYGAGVSPAQVQFVEAHATSTQVGDATETQALSDFFRPHHAQGKLPVGSVKSNIGHTLETAGLAGLLKTILAMKHAEIPATINLDKLSDSIDWANAPFYVPTERQPWAAPANGLPRCSAVNAFGIGGLNVHVVAQQYSPEYHGCVLANLLPNSLMDASIDSKPHVTVPALATTTRQSEPIAIVGIGVILPGAQSVTELEHFLNSDGTAIVDPPMGRCDVPCDKQLAGASSGSIPIPTFQGGYLTDYHYDWKRHRVPPKQVAQANPLQFMLLDAAGQAILSKDSASIGTVLHEDANLRTSVVVGTVFGGEFGHQLQIGLRLQELRKSLKDTLKKASKNNALRTSESSLDKDWIQSVLDSMEKGLVQAHPALLDETGSFTSSTLASRITKQFHLLGGAMAIDAGDCSADAALHTSIGMLRNGSSDAVLCAAGQRAMDYPTYQTWAARNLFHRNGSSNNVPGEGAVVLLLKRLSDAEQQGDTIRGLIHQVAIDSTRDDASQATYAIDRITSKTGDLKGAQGLASIVAALCDNNILDGESVSIVSDSELGLRYQTEITKGANLQTAGREASGSPHVSLATELCPPTISAIDESISAQPEASAYGSGEHSWINNWTRPQLAAVFPGQGSQSPDVLRAIANGSSDAAELLEKSNAILAKLGSPSLDALSRTACDSNQSSLDRIWPIQATVLVSNVASAAKWFQEGGRIDVVAGHSLGLLR